MKIDKQTILKFDRPGPRYTSYPTAPEWSDDVKGEIYAKKLESFGQSDKTLSLYVHIPFCETLCYFCACSMAVRPHVEKYGDEYLEYLFKEIDLVRDRLQKKKTVKQLHWGGGTPSFLSEAQMMRLFDKIEDSFQIDFNGEIAIEVDPRRVTENKIKTLRRLGFNRISVGVQDFDNKVQENINRIQPFEMVQKFHAWCRACQFQSINFDLIYGLPFQSVDTFSKTVDLSVSLRPDRIALYSFAHVPWLKKHQGKLDKAAIPGNDEKLNIFLKARELFHQAGYDTIAMDHFAVKEDELAKAYRKGTLYRNFMGYTVKPADDYIGLGTSAIGYLEQTYFQNFKTIPEYYRFLKHEDLPVERGKVLSQDDRMRQWVIRSLMCQFRLDKMTFIKKFQRDFDSYFQQEQVHIQHCLDDELLSFNGTVIEVTELGKLFIRNICMGFDWYLRQKDAHQRFSRTV